MNKKVQLFLIWLFFLIVGPGVVLLSRNLSVIVANRVLLVNLLQRIFGMAAFGMLSFQILLGGNMDLWRKRFGSWVLGFHKLNGVFVYSLIFIHPSLWIVWNYFIRGSIDYYYPFIDICGLCKGPLEYFYNLGRLGFWSITIAVMAARLVTMIDDKWLRKNWRSLHVLNYLAFYFVSIHAIFVGADSRKIPFVVFFVLTHLLVGYTIAKRLGKINWRKKFGQIGGL